MAQYTYTAVNQSGKKLSGLISAANEDEARQQLNTLGVSLLSISKTAETSEKTQTAEPAPSKDLNKFEFEAFDRSGKKVVGTIPASSRYKAFKRLVDEYGFEVAYVVKFGATEDEKEKAKHEDLGALKAEYEANTDTHKETEEAVITPEFEIKRKALLQKVDYILEKIKEVLASYSTQIKPENKKIIQDYVDKLLRIKSSTNLDYIEHVSEELLKKVQDQELFLHKEKMTKERGHLKLESQKMLSELHSRPSSKKDISDNLEDLQGKLRGSKIKFFQGLSKSLQRYLPGPEEKELRSTLRGVSKQVWIFRRIWLTSPKITKQEAYQSLQKIVEEKKRLKAQLKKLHMEKRLRAKQNLTGADENSINEPLVIEEINRFLAWLLGFYLLAYFFSHYVIAKTIPAGNPLPGDFNLLNSPILRYLLISIFLWFILLSLRLQYLRYKTWANGLVIGLGILLNASLVFNL